VPVEAEVFWVSSPPHPAATTARGSKMDATRTIDVVKILMIGISSRANANGARLSPQSGRAISEATRA
jgi:hypothetical protein